MHVASGFVGSMLPIFLVVLLLLSYYLSLRFEFRVVMSATISVCIRCSVRLYLLLFVGRLMSYLRYLYLFTYSSVKYVLCLCFVCLRVVSLVHNVDSVSELSLFDCTFGFL